MIFLVPPSAEVLYRRLVSRGTETMEKIRKRMARSAEEAAYIEQYDCILVNENLDACVEQLHQVIHHPELAGGYKEKNLEVAQALQKDIQKLLEKKEFSDDWDEDLEGEDLELEELAPETEE